jgi:hypothetical protein
MYVCKAWAIKTGPCTATFNDLFSATINNTIVASTSQGHTGIAEERSKDKYNDAIH